ncbi:MAG: AraC family transcriptional regulator [Luteibacter sp.]|uniref:helix-turn-helix domain-containing protein n=1 Tax=Luteibacter sp. TaxID=1886636 RepID=UPI00280A1B57|nr:AraC family transcriptional regulator [Luteibacter sp.]MDQ7998192.1 AraC family transcriptional regulator [Luteibacter sp.]
MRVWNFGEHMCSEALEAPLSQASRAVPSIARVRNLQGGSGRTSSYAAHEAFLVVLRLQSYRVAGLWADGKRISHDAVSAGTLSIYDLERQWVADMDTSFDCLQFHVPQETLDQLADDAGLPAGQRLHCPPESSVIDPVVQRLGHVLAPALEHPDEFPRIFVEHLTLAVQAHLVGCHATSAGETRSASSRLAPWQRKRALDFLGANLAKDVSLDDVARECRISRSHFIKAFKASVGLPPHQWILLQRVERAKQLMVGTSMSLADIATEVGFHDQSHLTRRFNRAVGATPAAWRRCQ